MKVAKIKETKKNEKELVTEEYSLKQMLKIIIILLIVFGIFYLITSIVVKSRKEDKKAESTNIVEIDKTKILLSDLLSKKESEYYVLATMESKYNTSEYKKIDYNSVYNNYIKSYSSKEGALNFYYVDLDDALNKGFVGTETYIGEDLNNLKLNDEVLFKISSGKIVESYLGNEEIINALSDLKG